ncbi:hypothetical protein GMOD_00008552 [Pyrenophora seminiperda CCB06]|uniref:Uncharacterized protein n=1 Tax=Pyrenophora seminiperda CCB06 TaxID=1302712 RepID=A0A3M7M8R4_9PLEO|nr:hypothetical protein GMOD_00008552 [Pyrenophora seminiperda CCB06]
MADSASAIPQFLFDLYTDLYKDGHHRILAFLPATTKLEISKTAETYEQPLRLYIGSYNGAAYVYPDGSVTRSNGTKHITQEDLRYLPNESVPAPLGWHEDIWQGLKEPMDPRSLALIQHYFLVWACEKGLWHVKLPRPNYSNLRSCLDALQQTEDFKKSLKESAAREKEFNESDYLERFRERIESSKNIRKEHAEAHKALTLPTKTPSIKMKRKIRERSKKTSVQAQGRNRTVEQKADEARAKSKNDTNTVHQLLDDNPITSECASTSDSTTQESSLSYNLSDKRDSGRIAINTELDLESDNAPQKEKLDNMNNTLQSPDRPVAEHDGGPGAYDYLLKHILGYTALVLSGMSESWLGRFEKHTKQHTKGRTTFVRLFLANYQIECGGADYYEQSVWAYLAAGNDPTTEPKLILELENRLPGDPAPHHKLLWTVGEPEPEEGASVWKQLPKTMDAENWGEVSALVQYWFLRAAEERSSDFSYLIFPVTRSLLVNLDRWASRKTLPRKQDIAVDQNKNKKPIAHGQGQSDEITTLEALLSQEYCNKLDRRRYGLELEALNKADREVARDIDKERKKEAPRARDSNTE